MAMQTGVGLSKVIILFGAGYTGTILLKNGKLSDMIGELQAMVKGLEKSGDSANADSDPVAAQMRWLQQEIRNLAHARPVTVLNGSSGSIDVTSLILPVTALGAVGYGYMWWKGFSFSDLMYVTKRNMATAVANLTTHLESVSDALAKAKKHLAQRIERVDAKVDDMKDMTKLIQNDVSDVRGDLSRIGSELYELKYTVSLLDGRISSMDDKMNLTLDGVDYLCRFVDGRKVQSYNHFLQDQAKLAHKSRGMLTSSEAPLAQGLKEIADIFSAPKAITSGSAPDGADISIEQPRSFTRATSIKHSLKPAGLVL
uniref:BZIP7 n=1 Tax=Tamarix hispida TaxID=189793 RepID=I7D4A7_9CARY|nr:bZIP7 [Tamarix hispida]